METDLKTYQAPSMSDALAKVKADLGKDAVILHTRSIRRGGVLGVGGRSIVEITARSDTRIPQTRPAAQSQQKTPDVKITEPVNTLTDLQAIRAEASKIQELENSLATTEASVQAEVEEIRAMLDDLLQEKQEAATSPVPAELLEFHTKLISQQVAEEIVRDVLAQVQTTSADSKLGIRDQIEAKLFQIICDLLPETGESHVYAKSKTQNPKSKINSRPSVIALVGPTGVGKTTTIAKLAANMKIRDGYNVGLITIDTYRIAAVEQLKTYAQILKIPVVAVLTPSDIYAAMDQLSEMDVILIDTAGRSQRDELRIAELGEFLEAAGPDQVHLVLSSTSSESSIREAIEKFSPVGANHVIFTKLDEAVGFGVILNVLRTANIRLSYLTTGQSVPDDIEPGAARRVAQLILHGEIIDRSQMEVNA